MPPAIKAKTLNPELIVNPQKFKRSLKVSFATHLKCQREQSSTWNLLRSQTFRWLGHVPFSVLKIRNVGFSAAPSLGCCNWMS